MKKYLMALFLMLFVIFICGCQPEKENLTIVIKGESVLTINTESQYSVDFSVSDTSYSQSNIEWTSEDEEVLSHLGDGKFFAKKVIDEVKIYAVLLDNPNTKAEFSIQIIEEVIEEIDLGGYSIKMGIDNLYDSYVHHIGVILGLDYMDIQNEAIKIIEEKYNCNIEFKRIKDGDVELSMIDKSVLMAQLRKDLKEEATYDFMAFQKHYLNDFVADDLLLELPSNNQLNDKLYSTGLKIKDLYTFQDINNVQPFYLIYNKNFDDLDVGKSPKELFEEGNWTYSTFIEYCEKVQAKLEEKYGELGNAGSEKQQYFAIGGSQDYLWCGLKSTTGDLILDGYNNVVNLDNTSSLKVSETVKQIMMENLLSDYYGVRSLTFNNAYFYTYSFYDFYEFISFNKDCQIEYIPWPMMDESTLDDYCIAVSDVSYSWCMLKNRSEVYKEYGFDCSEENIYTVIKELFDIIYSNFTTIPFDEYYETFMNNMIKEDKIYIEPLFTGDQYDYLYDQYYSNVTLDGIAKAINDFIYNDITWEEAIIGAVDKIQAKLNYENELLNK